MSMSDTQQPQATLTLLAVYKDTQSAAPRADGLLTTEQNNCHIKMIKDYTYHQLYIFVSED